MMCQGGCDNTFEAITITMRILNVSEFQIESIPFFRDSSAVEDCQLHRRLYSVLSAHQMHLDFSYHGSYITMGLKNTFQLLICT